MTGTLLRGNCAGWSEIFFCAWVRAIGPTVTDSPVLVRLWLHSVVLLCMHCCSRHHVDSLCSLILSAATCETQPTCASCSLRVDSIIAGNDLCCAFWTWHPSLALCWLLPIYPLLNVWLLMLTQAFAVSTCLSHTVEVRAQHCASNYPYSMSQSYWLIVLQPEGESIHSSWQVLSMA